MTDRPGQYDGESRQTDALAPENRNSEQFDAGGQAQTVAEQALDRNVSVLGLQDSEKLESSLFASDAQDLVDHMKQMDTSGTIDMSAYRGEPNHDDNVDLLGPAAKLDGLIGDGS
ncbi:MAG: hypothetical protein KDE55_11400 [Novosphingobium sp.]|nr:hypothetical protein [Novosphingobium sp.]